MNPGHGVPVFRVPGSRAGWREVLGMGDIPRMLKTGSSPEAAVGVGVVRG